MANLYNVDSPIDRVRRNNLNDTLADILRRFLNLQMQINILSGASSVEEVLTDLNEAINNANTTVAELQSLVADSIEGSETATQSAINNLNTELAAQLTIIDARLTTMQTAIEEVEIATDDANTATANTTSVINDARQAITDINNLIASMSFKGEYNASTTYNANNIVRYGKSSYVSLKTQSGVTPNDDGVNWRLVAAGGIDGTGAVSTVNDVEPDENGNVILDVPSQQEFEELKSDVTQHFNLSTSVLKIPLKNDFRGWQGVAVHNNLIYVFTDRNENFDLENIISVYTLDGKFVSEIRNAYTGLDPQGRFMSFGDANVIDGFIFVTAYNINSGGSPLISRIIKYNALDLSIISTYEIGGDTAESVTKHNNYYWVVYHDAFVVRQFDLTFNFIREFALPTDIAHHGGYQGSLWEDGYFYANLHGHNSNDSSNPFAELRKFSFNGTTFAFEEKIEPPSIGCGQGMAKYGDYYFWNDRPNNAIVITKALNRGNIFSETLPYQKEDTFKINLMNGWEPFDLAYDRPPRITVSKGIVYLSGMAKNLTNTNAYDGATPMFRIPKQYSPKYSINVMALTDKGILRIPIVGRNSISSANDIGNLNLQNILNITNIGWVSLDGISYPILD